MLTKPRQDSTMENDVDIAPVAFAGALRDTFRVGVVMQPCLHLSC